MCFSASVTHQPPNRSQVQDITAALHLGYLPYRDAFITVPLVLQTLPSGKEKIKIASINKEPSYRERRRQVSCKNAWQTKTQNIIGQRYFPVRQIISVIPPAPRTQRGGFLRNRQDYLLLNLTKWRSYLEEKYYLKKKKFEMFLFSLPHFLSSCLLNLSVLS